MGKTYNLRPKQYAKAQTRTENRLAKMKAKNNPKRANWTDEDWKKAESRINNRVQKRISVRNKKNANLKTTRGGRGNWQDFF